MELGDDDRGSKCIVRVINDVARDTGLKRAEFVGKEDTKSFWKTFLIAGVLFAVSMQLIVQFSRIAVQHLFSSKYGADQGFDLFWFLIHSLFSFLFFGTLMGFLSSKISWRTPKHAKAALLRVGLCPSCAYDIGGVPNENDGCTVCPECSAAWKIARVEPS